MASEADELNILGNKTVLIADAILVLAATTEAEAKNIEDSESQKLASQLADSLNITGAWIELLGDYILLQAAESEFEENIKSGEPFNIRAGKINIAALQAQVIIDFIQAQLAEEEAGGD